MTSEPATLVCMILRGGFVECFRALRFHRNPRRGFGPMLQHLAGGSIPDLLQAHAGGIDAEQPGDEGAKKRRPDENVKKR